MPIQIASRSEVGARTHNEDDLRYGSNGPLRFVVVSDGAGGHSNGAMASDLVVRTTALVLQRTTEFTPAMLVSAIEQANEAVNAGQQGLRAHQRMHATVVCLWLDASGYQALWAHVGDSRLYRVRRGRAHALTRDDSVVQQMVDAGFIKPDEARHHPRKNQLLAAMGMEEAMPVHVSPQAESVQDGDAYLLCSDGWWDHLDLEDLEDTLLDAPSAQAWVDKMAELVAQRQKPNQDNYTAVAVWVGNPGETTRVG
ncbi:MAG: serine/threonine-protein phosphatase [Burkholderiales bacterium]|nr:serine/threonine-protein phosphatase [Burkholderiales bacterium]